VAPLLGRTTTELEALCQAAGEPSYRGRQLAAWLYQRAARNPSEMTDLPAGFRALLAAETTLGRSHLQAEQLATDGTRRLLLALADGVLVETVGLPSPDRLSCCVSSQTGCAVGCTFCATGFLGAGRNLTAGEIVDQVLTVGERAARRVSHVVFMGMGEPLLNLEQVLRAVRLLSSEVGLSQRQVTISTVGLPPQIEALAAEDLNCTLAIPLHAADDALRQQLVPTTARRWSVAQILAAARAYAGQTGRRVTYEMVLLAGVNDRPADARLAAERLRRGDHVNLIPFNPIGEAAYQRPDTAAVRQFRAVLEAGGITVTQRQTRGRDIQGACGQLRASQS